MKTLEEKIEKMLNGEKKRREIALEWLHKVTETLKPICVDLYGDSKSTENMYEQNTDAIQIKVSEQYKPFYFRYSRHDGANTSEFSGFYGYHGGHEMYWGDPVEDMSGADFWFAIRTIMNWLPELEKLIADKEISRNSLCSRLLV